MPGSDLIPGTTDLIHLASPSMTFRLSKPHLGAPQPWPLPTLPPKKTTKREYGEVTIKETSSIFRTISWDHHIGMFLALSSTIQSAKPSFSALFSTMNASTSFYHAFGYIRHCRGSLLFLGQEAGLSTVSPLCLLFSTRLGIFYFST